MCTTVNTTRKSAVRAFKQQCDGLEHYSWLQEVFHANKNFDNRKQLANNVDDSAWHVKPQHTCHRVKAIGMCVCFSYNASCHTV